MTKGSEGIKGHEHSASHAHAHHEHHDGEFLTQVRALKDAEKSAASHVEGARAEAAKIEAAARESAVEIASKAQQKAVEAKNEIYAKRREQTEAEAGAIMGAAKKQASSIRAKRLSDTDVAEISQDI
jgi:vacuolar-type H+-ATPase subunit H